MREQQEGDEIMTFNNLIASWLGAKKELADKKAAEATLRASVMESWHDPSKEEGTENYETHGGKLTIVNALEYKMSDKNSVDAALKLIAQRTPEGAFVANRLVKWVPELVIKEYRLLAKEDKDIIDKVITTKPKAAQVSFKSDSDT